MDQHGRGPPVRTGRRPARRGAAAFKNRTGPAEGLSMTSTRLVAHFAACGVLIAVAGSARADGPKPNVIVVLADDLGWGDLSCYGGTIGETPCIDRMAREGVKYTQAYVA